MAEKIRVLVADDHPAFREGLCHLLDKEVGMEVVAAARDGEEAVRLAKDTQPDVAIIDVVMPKVNGIKAAEQIHAACQKTAILMVSAFDYKSYLVASLRLGAAGYLLKNAPVSELIAAIRMVYNGEAVFNLKTMVDILAQITANNSIQRKSSDLIHERELEVLKLGQKEQPTKRLAESLVLASGLFRATWSISSES